MSGATASYQRLASLENYADPSFEVSPYYWVPNDEVVARLGIIGWKFNWLMGWKDVTSATNERTMIAGVVPRTGVGNNLPLMFPDQKLGPSLLVCLLACISSLVLDFVARQKIGGNHVNFFYVEQFPILRPAAFSSADIAFIVLRVRELTYTSHSMRPFAEDLGFSGVPFHWDDSRRALLRSELDAKIAKLYGLTRNQLRYILDPTDVYGPSYPSETFRVLKKIEPTKYGAYRTARLVLNAWDRMERGELTT